jgi:chromosome partitioning protein
MDDATRTIALLNQKGGVGKTTTTVNLGAGLARLGRRVLAVDLDPQAHLTLHISVDPTTDDASDDSEPTATVYDLVLDPSIDPRDAVQRAGGGLDVIAAEVDLAAAEVELASAPDRYMRLARHLERLAPDYDIILLDCPPSLGLLTINALACSTEVIVPMQAHFLALQGVSKLLETVSMMSAQVNPALRVSGVVLCMHDTQARLSNEVVADLQDFFEQSREQAVPWRDARVLEPHIRRNIKLAESPSFGQSIFDYEPGCAGAKDYEALARTVLELGERDETPTADASSNGDIEILETPCAEAPEEDEPPVVETRPIDVPSEAPAGMPPAASSYV